MAKKKKGFKIKKGAGGGIVIPEVDSKRKQPKRKHVEVPGAKSGSFGDAGLSSSQGGVNLPHGKVKDHGPRLDEGHYPSPPRKRRKKKK